jgi:hypothetical protein
LEGITVSYPTIQNIDGVMKRVVSLVTSCKNENSYFGKGIEDDEQNKKNYS